MPPLGRCVDAALPCAESVPLATLTTMLLDVLHQQGVLLLSPVSAHEIHTICRNYLVPEDFRGFLPPEKAREAFHYIDDNDSGRAAQSELLNAVVQIFRFGHSPDSHPCRAPVRRDACCLEWGAMRGVAGRTQP
jgi:hypothetical protein